MHKRTLLLILLLATLVVLVGCATPRQGVSWAEVMLFDEDNNVFIAYNDFIVLIDPANGRPVQLRDSEGNVRTDEEGAPRRWEVTADGAEFFTPPIIREDNSFLIADYNNRLARVNTRLAEVEEYVTELPGHVIANPATTDELVIVPFIEENIAAYDLDTFEQVWLYETERGIWADPIVINNTVYFAGMDHNFYALDAATGEEQWVLDTGGAMAAPPLYHEGRFFIGTFTRRILEISTDGEIVNEFSTDNWVWSTPTLYEDVIYATDLSGIVYALNISDGGLNERWRTQVSSRGIRPSPLVTDEYVIVADRGGRVYWLERATGTVIEDFTKEAGGEVLSEILLLEREEPFEPLVLVSTVQNNRLLVAYTLDSVAQWTYDR